MMPDPEGKLRLLKESRVFQDVPEEQLRWLLNRCEHLILKTSDFLFRKGDPLNRMIILLKGSLSYQQKQNNGSRTLDEVVAGEVTGALPYSRATSAIAELKVQEEGEALSFSSDHFKEMILEHFELTEVLVHTMTTRVREFTRSQQHSEKMAALGKLSAGLAHELNNPASAVLRSSSELKKQIISMPEGLSKILEQGTPLEAFQYLQEMITSKANQESLQPLSLLEKSSIEDEHVDWLENQGLEKPYNLAETLAEFRYNKKELDQLKEQLEEKQLKPVLQWLCTILSMEKLAEEIQHSSKRISELVNAVKTYSHMDKSPEKEHTDLLKGIKDTLTILNFKIRKKKIEVKTDFPADLPKVCVYAGELNQLWTNLLDNSIDALEEGGEINISLSSQSDHIIVKVRDNGPGIPEEIQDSIFDPFFTTKSLGKGSGMGLDIVKRIVEDHEGSIELESKPGETTFTISLPL